MGVAEGALEGVAEGALEGVDEGSAVGEAVGVIVGGVVGGEQIPHEMEQFAATSFLPQYLSILSSTEKRLIRSHSQSLNSPGKLTISNVNVSLSAALVQSTSGLGVGAAVGEFVGEFVGDGV